MKSKLPGARPPGMNGKARPSAVGHDASGADGTGRNGEPGSGFWAVVVLVCVFGLGILFYNSQVRLDRLRLAGAEGRLIAAVASSTPQTIGRGAHSSPRAEATAADLVLIVPTRSAAGAGQSSLSARSEARGEPPAGGSGGSAPTTVAPLVTPAIASLAGSNSTLSDGAVGTDAQSAAAARGPAPVATSGPGGPVVETPVGVSILSFATSLPPNRSAVLPLPLMTMPAAAQATLPPLSIAGSLAGGSATPSGLVSAAGAQAIAAAISTTVLLPEATIPVATATSAPPAVAATADATQTSVAAPTLANTPAVLPDTPTPTATPLPVPTMTAEPPTATSPATSTPNPVLLLSPTPSAAPPTAEPTPTLTATPVGVDVTALIARVNAVEIGLQAGRIITTSIDVGQRQTQADVSFDLSTGPAGPRLETKLTGPAPRYERLVIGARVWQRWGQGAWDALAIPGDAAAEIREYLPQPSPAAIAQPTQQNRLTILTWHDLASNTDIALTVDTATAVPRQLRRVNAVTGSVLIVEYKDWNLLPTFDTP